MIVVYRRRRSVRSLAEFVPEEDRDAVRELLSYLWATEDRATTTRSDRESADEVSGKGRPIPCLIPRRSTESSLSRFRT